MLSVEQRQAYPLDLKIEISKKRIKAWYEYWNGQVYVSYSGGKDSTVLLHLVRSLYPDVKAVFVDTGLEYPEIRDFVQATDNVEILKPKKSFKKVLEDHGYPVVSKQVSMALSRYQKTTCPIQKRLRLHGGINPNNGRKQNMGIIPKKYHYLTEAPFKISEYCCNIMKKDPAKLYAKHSGLKPFIGTMACDSRQRFLQYQSEGCNSFKEGNEQSRPLGFWREKDIWRYIQLHNVPYCDIYDKGIRHTGCMFCMFGLQNDVGKNRFQEMKETHPKQYEYCINKLKLGEILDYMGVPYD